MLVCWNEQPKERSTFKELRAKFDAMLLTEKKDTYIALCIDESKSYYQSLTPVTTKEETRLNVSCTFDKYLPTRKRLASFKQSSVSLDEAQSASRRKENDRTRDPERLSLQGFTQGLQGQSETQDRYVPSPALSQSHMESEIGFEM